MDHRRLEWERLIQSLDDWGSAREGEPGRIHVLLPDGSREVTIVMTPEEWEDITGVMWGNFGDAVQDVKETLLNLEASERFARYSQYRLYGSEDDATTAPADDDDRAAEPGGEWSTVDRNGHVSRFARWLEPDRPEE